MPETAIDKHGEAIPIKNKIGSTKQIWVAAPASYAIGTKNQEEPSFCCLSALAKNSRHYLGTFGFRKNVRHMQTCGESCTRRRELDRLCLHGTC